jgi:hypothetical protein
MEPGKSGTPAGAPDDGRAGSSRAQTPRERLTPPPAAWR